jgi:hypothetical protein
VLLTHELRNILVRYRVPHSLLQKEVLVDTEFLEEFTRFGDVFFPYAFPGLIFRYVGGIAADDTRFHPALRALYPHIRITTLSSRYAALPVFVEAPPQSVRDVIATAVISDAPVIMGVARESVVASVVAEPGDPDYSALSAFVQTYYDIDDAYRLPSDAFYPVPRGSMAGFVLKRVSDHDRYAEKYWQFLRTVFTNKRRKIEWAGNTYEVRPQDAEPETLRRIFETTLG